MIFDRRRHRNFLLRVRATFRPASAGAYDRSVQDLSPKSLTPASSFEEPDGSKIRQRDARRLYARSRRMHQRAFQLQSRLAGRFELTPWSELRVPVARRSCRARCRKLVQAFRNRAWAADEDLPRAGSPAMNSYDLQMGPQYSVDQSRIGPRCGKVT